ncbi:Cof-type HAD-IIB family hydrolase [Bacillus testis]|uniref:Cof-type HAD-IIB family hydrolase n=1 Tax=Bacillus testis TaxID=1622072 RepID=UPI00067F6507|nr:Cof-type HAD-IIB family hydrolase [Bacillus testis]
MIKCIASDMDGTLLNREDKISQSNKEAIEKAQEMGIEVVIATGRSYVEARHVLNEANLNCPVISINGAVVWGEDGKVVTSNPMKMEDVRTAAAILDEAGIFYEVFTNEGTFSCSKGHSVATIVDIMVSAFPDLDPAFVAMKATERFESGYIHAVDSYKELFEREDLEFYKFLAFSGELDTLTGCGKTISDSTSLAVSSSGKENLEITSLEAQKGIALEKFVAARNISLSETMAIGDSFNDVSMFKKAGKAVAMGNAISEIKEICDEVTLPNDKDGVAHAILKAIAEQ